MKKIINCATGEEKEVELTAKDVAQQKIDEADYAAKEVEEQAKTAARQAALAKLGLSAEDAAAIFG